MLIYSEIAQLSDKDLADEAENTKNSLFRQKMGVKTAHLKDVHLVRVLKKYLAQLLTELVRRKNLGEKVEKTSAEVSKKAKEMHSEIEKAQVAKKEKKAPKADKKKTEEKVEVAETQDKDAKVKVKKVEKKGLLKKVFGKKEAATDSKEIASSQQAESRDDSKK
jgi:ribosomal protein L29